MTPTIEVDDEVFALLQRHGQVFVDTPNTVLRRLLGLDANGHQALVNERRSALPPGHQAVAEPETQTGVKRTRDRKPRTPGAPSAKRTRAARGSLLPASEYERPILQYLHEHDGRAPSREIIDAIGEELADRFTEADSQPLNSGEVRWKSRAAFVRLRLVERGDLDGQAPRGTWQITEQGRQRLRAGQ